MAKKRSGERREFVLDSSVTMSWYFKDEANPYANDVQKALAVGGAVVPALWPLEVANILVMGDTAKRSTEAEASRWLGYLTKLPIRIDDESTRCAWSDVLHVARSYDLSAYDAAYLELAIRSGLPMASLDSQLLTAAVSAGVAKFDP